MKKKKQSISDRARRSMPYELRIQYYNREKNELLNRMSNKSAEDFSTALDELIKKWGV